jgi:hypothetical protein
MNCFVIMPFAPEFNDVYATIKSHVDSELRSKEGKCTRLDEHRPAGRITDRLLAALRESSFCIADLTGCTANVMWETGYAMALNKPLVIVTQDLATLPFDVKDMQALGYDRRQLYSTLGMPLQRIIRDTIAYILPVSTSDQDSTQESQLRLISGLGVQLAELKNMVGEIVHAWGSNSASPMRSMELPAEFKPLEGAWYNEQSKSYIYVQNVDGRLVAPYCYNGNDNLTAHYYGWRKLGDYFFARFRWMSGNISGFTFLKHISKDVLQGAWWYEDEVPEIPAEPIKGSGTQVTWRRMPAAKSPAWAIQFLQRVKSGEVKEV